LVYGPDFISARGNSLFKITTVYYTVNRLGFYTVVVVVSSSSSVAVLPLKVLLARELFFKVVK